MLDKPKSKLNGQGDLWENPYTWQRRDLSTKTKRLRDTLRKAIAKKAGTAARLKAAGGIPEEV